MDKQKILAELGIKAQLFLVMEGCQGCGSIYLSNYFSALHISLLESRQIKSVLTIAKGFRIEYPQQKIPQYLYIPIQDKHNADIYQYLGKCFEFIDRSRQKTNILIHCKAGVSRSATLMTSYIMRTFTFSVREAYGLVKRANHKVKPNRGFIHMLQNYHNQLYGEQAKFNSKLNEFVITNKQKQLMQESKMNNKISQKNSLCLEADYLDKEKKKIDRQINHVKALLLQNQIRNKSMPEHIRIKLQQLNIKTNEVQQ